MDAALVAWLFLGICPGLFIGWCIARSSESSTPSASEGECVPSCTCGEHRFDPKSAQHDASCPQNTVRLSVR